MVSLLPENLALAGVQAHPLPDPQSHHALLRPEGAVVPGQSAFGDVADPGAQRAADHRKRRHPAGPRTAVRPLGHGDDSAGSSGAAPS